ncbi:MAG TPA: DUF72 domain-containing protein [Burkholderiaceae bacterium]|nr:DUF72 domain-containing protein [Burkholderiaceae bacterium]
MDDEAFSPPTPVLGPARPGLTWPGHKPMPSRLYLGTSSWNFPGWHQLVWDAHATESLLAREGLTAYSRHPLLRSVGIDRTFYAPIEAEVYRRYASQVDQDFRFLVKAPSIVTDAMTRDAEGRSRPNERFLDAEHARACFIEPCLKGLGEKAGVLLFQCSPMPASMLARICTQPAQFTQRIARFFSALPAPADLGAPSTCYALELRNTELLTPRLIAALREGNARLGIGLHPRMPPIARQASALAALDGDTPRGPLVIRWSLLPGMAYEEARQRFAPFKRLVVPDPHTRQGIADLAVTYLRAHQPVHIIVNNKAEGSAPRSLVALAEVIARGLEH